MHNKVVAYKKWSLMGKINKNIKSPTESMKWIYEIIGLIIGFLGRKI